MLEDAKDDTPASCGFPQQYWRQTWSRNPLERINEEIKRRTDGADRRYFSEHSMKLLHAETEDVAIPELNAE